MIIEIDDTKTIGEIRKAFSERYPFLSLEFYDEPHEVQEVSSTRHVYPHDKKIREIRKRHNPGMLEIHSHHKTGVVELEFRERYGLNVQVLRHHGHEWLQTAGTDELTLEEQNEIGRSASPEYLHGPERRLENEKLL